MAKILIFTIGYYGSWIQEKVIVTSNFKTICFTNFLQNTEVHRTILYEIQRPKEAKLKKHPDVSSLEVVSARASLHLNLTIDILYIRITVSTDTFQKVRSHSQTNSLRNLLIYSLFSVLHHGIFSI
jgi:hypothetical protein